MLWAFTQVEQSNLHPLTWLSHMLDIELFGINKDTNKPNPGGPHWMNLVIHLGNTLLLFFLLKAITGAPWRSAVVAALFAVHPMHVESVALGFRAQGRVEHVPGAAHRAGLRSLFAARGNEAGWGRAVYLLAAAVLAMVVACPAGRAWIPDNFVAGQWSAPAIWYLQMAIFLAVLWWAWRPM